MDLTNLFTEQRWNILCALSKGNYSPMQLAEQSGTTMANISQQLRLLEASNLVKKQKISNRDKGKPRTLFSLSEDYAYVISATKGFSEKKLIALDKFHKILLRLWFLKDLDSHYYAEKFLWSIEEIIDHADFIAISISGENAEAIISGKSLSSIEKKAKDTIIKRPNKKAMPFKVKALSNDDLKKQLMQKKGIFSSGNYLIIYDTFIQEKGDEGGDTRAE